MRDLAPWRRRATVSMAALAEWAAALPARASRRLVLLRQGRVVLLPHPGQGDTPSYGCTEPCDPIMQDLLAGEVGRGPVLPRVAEGLREAGDGGQRWSRQ